MVGMVVACFGAWELPNFPYAVQSAAYADSQAKESLLFRLGMQAYQVAAYYGDEENIRSGATIASQMQYYQRDSQLTLNQRLRDINDQYAVWLDYAMRTGNTSEADRLTAERDRVISEEQASAEADVADHRNSLIAQDLAAFHSLLHELDTDSSFYYVSLQGQTALSNLPAAAEPTEFFAELPAWRLSQPANGASVYVGVDQSKYGELEQAYLQARAAGISGCYRVLAGLALFLIGLGYLMFTAGCRPGRDGIQLAPIDRLYLDVGLVLLGCALTGAYVLLAETWMEYQRSSSQLLLVFTGGLAAVVAVSLVIYGTVFSKRVKRGEVLRHTLCYASLAWLFRVVRRCWRGTVQPLWRSGPLALRLIGLLLTYVFGSVIAIGLAAAGGIWTAIGLVLLLGLNVGAFALVARKWSVLQQIARGAEKIKDGDLSHRLPIDSNAELASLALSINNIANGLQAAVEKEVKAERMQAELITNVSHDLKTPLTSLITYIDLLKTEGLSSEHAPHYLQVLDQKSQRLKTLTEDLFEAAKAASGSLTVELNRLEIGSLLHQGLAELSERIEQSGLDFRLNLPEEKVYVQADGRMLWRVLENLIQNAIKYALPQSRVYVQVLEQGAQVAIVFKNVSAAPLNIDPEELLERFKRGDESRHSEGSGLGLAIAKSLTELQRGSFQLEIDGDLFKATVRLPRSQ